MSDIENRIIEKLSQCPIYNKPKGWVIEYPQFSKLADEQMHTFWPWDEPKVENDLQDLRVNMTPAEHHGIVTVLKLFTLYEMHVGDDYWTGRIMKKYQRPEIQRAASLFGAVEFNSHAPFYNKINETLFLDTEEFYSSWEKDPYLRERMAFIGKYADHPNDLLSEAAFSMIEGAVLYSSFGYLKHFQAQECGKNLISNICSGANLSVGDENTHAVGGALLFRIKMEEGDFTEEEKEWIKQHVIAIAHKVKEHEDHIVDMIFSEGEISGITAKQMKSFVAHRVNLCLTQLGYEAIFEEQDEFIKGWFYKNINSVQFHDFFQGSGSEYNINWKEQDFGGTWEV